MRRTLLMIAGTAFVCSLFVPNHVISSGDGGSVLMSDDLYPWIAMVCGLLGFFWPKDNKPENDKRKE